MIIRERVLESQKRAAASRLTAMKNTAPAFMIAAQEKLVADLDNGICKVKGLDKFGDLEIADAVQKTGRMGKPFAEITTTDGRKIFYFPCGKWGAFLNEFENEKES